MKIGNIIDFNSSVYLALENFNIIIGNKIMSDDPVSYGKGFFFGLVFGGMAGAVAALLLAPKTGEEMRQDIADKSSQAIGKAQGYLTDVEVDLSSAVRSTVNEGRTRAEKIINDAKSKADDILASADNILSDAKVRASGTKEIISEKVSDVKDIVSDKVDSVKGATKAGVDAFRQEINQVR